MGAWGHNAFENDTAADWLADLKESDFLPFTEEALQMALPSPLALMQGLAGSDADDYLDADVACTALVAAEAVAAWRGKPHAEFPDEAAAVISHNAGGFNPDFADLALMAVRRIGARSELRDLWEETDDFPAWMQEMKALEARLTGE